MRCKIGRMQYEDCSHLHGVSVFISLGSRALVEMREECKRENIIMPNNDILYRRPVARGGEILTADAMHNSPANDAIASTMAKGCRSVCILIILRAV